VLQVTNLHYPKPTKKAAVFVPCIVLVILLWVLDQKMATRVAALMIWLGLGYVLFGPLFIKGMAAHKARRETRAAADGDDGGAEADT
jgi:sugar phosphate permease